jgi:hypothetical protein
MKMVLWLYYLIDRDHSTLLWILFFRPNDTEFEKAKEFDLCDEDSSDEEWMDDETDLDPGLIRITNQNFNTLTSDQPFLVYQQCLMQLASLVNVKNMCNKCSAAVTLVKNIIGTALHLKWVSQYCLLYHLLEWKILIGWWLNIKTRLWLDFVPSDQ